MIVTSPVAGALHSLADAPDPVFAQELVGSGVIVFPDVNQDVVAIHAPIDGTAIKVMPHAFIIFDGTQGVLVHVGIDTVGLGGNGFNVHITEGQTVTAGQLVIEVQTAVVKEAGYSLGTPVILMDSQPGSITVEAVRDVNVGDQLFTVA